MGSIWQRRGRWAAKYQRDGQWHTPGHTFASFKLADDWLVGEENLIRLGDNPQSEVQWTPPATRRAEAKKAEERATTTFGDYAATYITEHRTSTGRPLGPSTVAHYRSYLKTTLKRFHDVPLADITPEDVDAWWSDMEPTPAYRSKSYVFLKQVMAHAITRRGGAIITVNPCQITKATRFAPREAPAVRDQRIVTLTTTAVAQLAEAMPERHKALILLLAFTAMRPGEAWALTRSSLVRTMKDGLPCWTVSITQAATTERDDDGVARRIIGGTKTDSSMRFVYLPPHLDGVLQHHLDTHAAPGSDGLVFPSRLDPTEPGTQRQLMGTHPSSGRPPTGFYRARATIGVDDLTVYDLRRWGRHILKRAGMSDLDVEQYMGHQLGAVRDAYAVVDPETAWNVVVRASELTGWTRPTPTTPGVGPQIPAKLLNAMEPAQLASVLEAMDEDALAGVVPQLSPATLARLLSSGLCSTGSARESAR